MATAQANAEAEAKRFDLAVDMLLNSGTLAPYIDDFWSFVDDEITEDEARERFPA